MKRCEVCNIEVDEHDFASHVLGKKHLKKLGSENFRKAQIEKSIYVSRLPPGVTFDNIVSFFSQFGVIQRCKFEPNFAIIEFVKKETTNFLLTRTIWMGDHKLDIKRRKFMDNRPVQNQQKNKKTASQLAFADLKTKLQEQTTFDGELSAFLDMVMLTDREVTNKWRALHSSLVETLKPVFPNCTINRFGSSVTGLCFKESDFDIYLDIGQPIYDDEEKKLGWTPRTIFREVKLLMHKRKNVFDQIVPIPKAKIPIIKFCHIPTKTSCDISFKNGLGVINSHLINQFLNADERFKPLMIIIKFWAKTFELSGCGKFTNYAVVMMIILYLQQPEIKLLPPIVELQKTCEPAYQWNWQVNFDRTAVFPTSNNTSTVLELLHGFFKFYENFPFDAKLMSPLDGCAHTRVDFAKLCAEKGGDTDYLALDRPVCLQDPFELDNNITVGVSSKVLKTFQSFCAVGVEVCEAALKNKDKPFLLNLFTTLPVPLLALDNQACHQITILAQKTLHVGLPEDFDSKIDIEDKKKFKENNWYTIVQGLIEDAMKRIFQLDVQMIKNDREVKQQKVEATSDVHSKDNDKIVLECTGSYCIISGRKSTSFSIDPTLSPINKEAIISEELVNKQKATGVKPMKVVFSCIITRELNPVRLVLQLNDHGSPKKRFRSLATYLEKRLPSIINKELIHMLQYNKR